MNVTAVDNLVSGFVSFYYLSSDAIKEAKAAFSSMQCNGVIRAYCRFEDDEWQTTDQYSNVGLHFDFNMLSYNANYQDLLGMTFDDFKDCVKAFIISFFGKNALLSIQSTLRDLRHIIATYPSDIYALSSDLHLEYPHMCEDFFSQLPDNPDNEENNDLQRLIEALDSYADAAIYSQRSKQRTLADFESYFLFDEYLKRFWASPDLPLEKRVFYFPIFLWWNLTAIIPLRPKEFLVLGRNCLSQADGKFFLHLRRSRLKGSKQDVSYNISDDFQIDTIQITNELGKAFELYINLTEDSSGTEIDTLFRTDSHYEKWGHSTPKTSRFLTYSNLRTILRYFYEEVLQGMYGLQTVCLDDGVHIAKGQISRIHLGDARHIALINLMHSGGTPLLAMLLAGHKNQFSAAHYYSNVEKLIECTTYLYQHQLLSDNNKMQIMPYRPLPANEGRKLKDGGKCYSGNYIDGDYNDCVAVIGPRGEIGYCPACPFYRAAGVSRYAVDDIYLRQLQNDCNGLAEAIEIVRKHKGNADIEEIGEALLKIQASASSYALYLREKSITEEGCCYVAEEND